MIEVNGKLFVVKRQFRVENFQKVIDHFGVSVVCENYHCDQILRGGNGFYYLVDRVDDAKII